MVRHEIIRRKLSHIHDYVRELDRHRDVSLDAYVAAGGPRREIERLLQLLVEASVDINAHVVTELGGSPPSDYHSSFVEAARHGLIPAELAYKLAPSAGLRNVLVHEYGDIEDAVVHRSIRFALDGLTEYVQAVEQWLEQREAD